MVKKCCHGDPNSEEAIQRRIAEIYYYKTGEEEEVVAGGWTSACDGELIVHDNPDWYLTEEQIKKIDWAKANVVGLWDRIRATVLTDPEQIKQKYEEIQSRDLKGWATYMVWKEIHGVDLFGAPPLEENPQAGVLPEVKAPQGATVWNNADSGQSSRGSFKRTKVE